MRRTLLRAALVAIVIGIAACNSRVDAPFGLEVAQEQQQYVLYLLNGAERTRVSDVKVTNGELTATFPGYENTLHAQVKHDSLEGSVTLIKAVGKEQVIPFTFPDVDGKPVSLFERHGDFATAAQAVRHYREDLNIDFPDADRRAVRDRRGQQGAADAQPRVWLSDVNPGRPQRRRTQHSHWICGAGDRPAS
jgi:hypothetical protein